jgi:hypothetical protein
MNMKNLILVMVALVSLSLSAQAGITKVYVGVEDGQFIFGLAGKIIDRKNGALQYDFRNIARHREVWTPLHLF